MVGLVHAQAALAQAATLPILHLQHINPYVTGAMEMGGTTGRWAVPRQSGALPTAADHAAAPAIGVSAFAFQGTNAHALAAAASQHAGASIAKPSADWARQRFWVAARTHAALHRAISVVGGRQILIQAAPLDTPALAYLWDHQVSGKALVPGAAFLELAAAAAHLPLPGSSQAGVVLTAATIPAPLVLPAPAQKLSAPAMLCTLSAASGSVEIASGQRSTHLRATMAVLSFSPVPSRAAVPSQPPALVRLMAIAQLHAAAPPRAEPAYFADIDAAGDQASDVALSPAVIDCCLHLGALPAAAAGQLKVPAGIEALLLPSCAPAKSSGTFAAAALQVESSSAASLINYSLLAPAGTSTSCIRGLQAKPLTARPQAAAAVAASSSGATRMLYQVGWTVQEPARQLAATTAAGPVAASLGCSWAALLCSTAMAAFQVAAAEQQGALSLLTTGAQPQLAPMLAAGSSSPASALLWGMLRSVALEQTAAAVAAADADNLAPGAAPGPTLHMAPAADSLSSLAHDAYGWAARSGLGYAAALEPAVDQPAADSVADQLHAIRAARGTVAVTGGMGSLGTVLALWAEEAQLGPGLVLLGRTGRLAAGEAASGLAGLLARSLTAVTLEMADVAASEGSMRALCAAGAGRTAPLVALFHSGGVLADATLAKQAPAGIRVVFAAKVAAAQRWRGSLTNQPAATEVLFSSVAALLGSGGQVNYSAANAALDAMATRLQQQVRGGFWSACLLGKAELLLLSQPSRPSLTVAGHVCCQRAVGRLGVRRHGCTRPLCRPARAAHGHGDD